MSFECLGKGEGVVVAHACGDAINADGFVSKELDGHLHAVGQEVLLEGVACGLLEKTGQVAAVQTKRQSDTVDLDGLGIFELNI